MCIAISTLLKVFGPERRPLRTHFTGNFRTLPAAVSSPVLLLLLLSSVLEKRSLCVETDPSHSVLDGHTSSSPRSFLHLCSEARTVFLGGWSVGQQTDRPTAGDTEREQEREEEEEEEKERISLTSSLPPSLPPLLMVCSCLKTLQDEGIHGIFAIFSSFKKDSSTHEKLIGDASSRRDPHRILVAGACPFLWKTHSDGWATTLSAAAAP